MVISKNKNILLVEDEAVIALMEKKNLEEYGYSVHLAYNGRKAIEIAFNNEITIDLILMDIDLGKDVDGTEAAATILQQRDIPIVFLSSHTEPEIVEKTETITSYGYVVKNSGIVVLDASIKMAFKLFDAHKELKKNNEDLRHHSQLLENIIENFPGFVLWKDTTSHFLGCNTNFAKKMGFTSPADIIGKCDYDLPFHTEEIEGFLKDDKEVMETRKPKLHFEEIEHIAHNELIYLDTCKIPLIDSTGKVYGLLAVAMDITAGKRDKEKMERQLFEMNILLTELQNRLKQ